jgi:hypothetical protein
MAATMADELIGLPDLAIRFQQDYRLTYSRVLRGEFGKPVRKGGRWYVAREVVEALEAKVADGATA